VLFRRVSGPATHAQTSRNPRRFLFTYGLTLNRCVCGHHTGSVSAALICQRGVSAGRRCWPIRPSPWNTRLRWPVSSSHLCTGCVPTRPRRCPRVPFCTPASGPTGSLVVAVVDRLSVLATPSTTFLPPLPCYSTPTPPPRARADPGRIPLVVAATGARCRIAVGPGPSTATRG